DDDSQNNSGSRYYEIGRAVVTDLFSDRSVSISTASWPTGNTPADALARQNRAMDCGDGCAASIPMPQASPQPVPTTAVMGSGPSIAAAVPTEAGKYVKRVK